MSLSKYSLPTGLPDLDEGTLRIDTYWKGSVRKIFNHPESIIAKKMVTPHCNLKFYRNSYLTTEYKGRVSYIVFSATNLGRP